MTTSVGHLYTCYALERRQRGADDVLRVRDRGLLEPLRVRHRHVGAGDPLDRRVEVVEGLLLDQRREVGADAAVRPALLDDHAAVRLADRVEDRVEVERAQRARVDHLGLDAVLVGERLRGLLGHVRHPQDADDRHVVPLAAHRRLAEADDLVVAVLGNLAAHAVEGLVLDEDHRVVVADRRLQQPLAVGRRRGQATSSPGICRNIASRLCEWVGPSWWPPPPGIRTTIGTRTWPPNM